MSAIVNLMMNRINRGNVTFDINQLTDDLSNIFIGSMEAARQITALKEIGITQILTVGELKVFNSAEEIEGLSYLKVAIADHPNSPILVAFQQSFEFIDNCVSKDRKILIHCASGLSRSVTVAALYIMYKFGRSRDEALSAIRKSRTVANPNVGFLHQMAIMEKCQNDLVTAIEVFKSENSKNGILSEIIMQRDDANEIHHLVDNLEINMNLNSECAAHLRPTWLSTIQTLEMRINNKLSINTDHSRRWLEDKVTDIILKSARTKLQGLKEELTNSQQLA